MAEKSPFIELLKSKGYAKKGGESFLSDFTWLWGVRIRTTTGYVKKHPFSWLMKRQLMVKFYTPSNC
jgi:hypothetical protein